MRRAIFGIARGTLLLAMIQAAGKLMHMLMQAAAKCDIQLLKTAADREQRFSCFDRGAQQRQSGGIADFIELRAGPQPRTVMMRSDIGGRF